MAALTLGALVSTLVGLGVAWILGAFGSSPPPPPAEQVRAIEKAERASRQGVVQNVQTNLPLHGDGTRSWVFEFAEKATGRLVIYDNQGGRLKEQFEVTNRPKLRPLPADFTYEGVPYRRLSPAGKRKAQTAWRRLYNPNVVFDRPVTVPINDGSRALLVSMTATTGPVMDRNTFRATLIAVFWSADDQAYVVHSLYALRQRWTLPGPSDLRLELRPGAGFRGLPTATDVSIDARAGLVYATVGGGLATLGKGPVQVHVFRLPLSPDDLEECPVLWQGAAPIGTEQEVPRMERDLSAGCPHV